MSGAFQGWKLGGGVEGVGRRFANADNSNALPPYTRVDALLEYSRPSNHGAWALKMNVINLFNTKYYEGVYVGHTVPGALRTVQVTGTYKF